MSAKSDRVVRLGEITGAHGVKGWVKVHSFTEPRTNLLEYRHWLLDHRGVTRDVEVLAGHESGRKIVAKLAGIDDRDLPTLEADEFYWADLEGLSVKNTAGVLLGTVVQLIATGAHDVLVLDGSEQRLIPFVRGRIVRRVDLDDGEIIVDWDTSFWE
jgi:16S rRNA processing protein RimM